MEDTKEGHVLTESATGLERQTGNIYGGYFGPSWRQEMADYLLAEIRVANSEDTARVGAQRGWTETAAEATLADNRIVKNHIVVHQLPSQELGDYALRTEVGEALYYLLENAAVAGKIPEGKNGVPKGFESLVESSPEPDVVAFCEELLDGWNNAYNQKPVDRYSGMNSSFPREYKNIPEWKSEGFSDGVAIEIRRKSGSPLSQRESRIWNSFTPEAKNILQVSVDQFVPPVVTR